MNMPRHLFTATALLLLVLPAPRGAAQEKPQGTFGEQVNVNEVLLDVLVTDADGKVILGLHPDDFVVKEDGRPVEVESVTFYSNRRLLDSPEELRAKGIAVDNVPAERYFIVFFDDQRRNETEAPGLLTQQLEAARQSKRWVDKELLLDDWVAVVSYDTKLKVQQDFTRDKASIKQAIDDAVTGKDPGNTWPSRSGAANEGPSLLPRLPQGNALRDATGNVYDAIRLLADAAGNVRGRKNLVLYTIGFGQITPFGQYLPDTRYYPTMMQALNTNNVAVYAVDLTPAGTEHLMSGAMNQIASDTGGRYLFNFTNFITPLRQIADENGGYYLLSYQSRHAAGAAGYQKVTVTTRNPEFKVRARGGYNYGAKP